MAKGVKDQMTTGVVLGGTLQTGEQQPPGPLNAAGGRNILFHPNISVFAKKTKATLRVETWTLQGKGCRAKCQNVWSLRWNEVQNAETWNFLPSRRSLSTPCQGQFPESLSAGTDFLPNLTGRKSRGL